MQHDRDILVQVLVFTQNENDAHSVLETSFEHTQPDTINVDRENEVASTSPEVASTV